MYLGQSSLTFGESSEMSTLRNLGQNLKYVFNTEHESELFIHSLTWMVTRFPEYTDFSAPDQ